MAFVDDFGRVLLVLGIAVESKSVLGLSIRDLVNPKIYNQRGSRRDRRTTTHT
jgi:hypothetical protein